MGTHTHKCTYACIPIGEHPHPHRHTQRKKSAKGYTAIPLTEVSKKVQAESKLMVFGNRGPVPGSLGTVKKQFSLCLHIPFHHFSETVFYVEYLFLGETPAAMPEERIAEGRTTAIRLKPSVLAGTDLVTSLSAHFPNAGNALKLQGVRQV